LSSRPVQTYQGKIVLMVTKKSWFHVTAFVCKVYISIKDGLMQ